MKWLTVMKLKHPEEVLSDLKNKYKKLLGRIWLLKKSFLIKFLTHILNLDNIYKSSPSHNTAMENFNEKEKNGFSRKSPICIVCSWDV